MFCAGILLTGGHSRRMGRDKASLRLAGTGPAGEQRPEATLAEGGTQGWTLAERTARLLGSVCSPAVEVGPGHTRLEQVLEDPPGGGPLAALVAGWEALATGGWHGPVVVVATDLPNLSASMIGWLAGYPQSRSVVPVAAGRVQPLCARYCASDMDVAVGLVAHGHRAMTALLEATDPILAAEDEWAPAAGGAQVLVDVDTPEDLRRVVGR